MALILIVGFSMGCGSGSSSNATPTYTVGGTITGLENSASVVLQNNAGDDLTVDANGSFTFVTGLANGATYEITVLTEPSGQTIALGNATGTVSAANVTDITVHCRAWSHPSDLTDFINVDGQTCTYYDSAADNDGNAIVVWRQSDGTTYQIFKSEYRSGSWTHPSGLSDNISPSTQHAYSPDVAMDDEGKTLIVWYQNNGTHNLVYKSEYFAGSWTHPADVTEEISPEGGGSAEPLVVMDGVGNGLVVWSQHDGSRYQIFKSHYR